MQINRLFEILYILLDKKTVTSREFSKHFEVSTRTIYRDVEMLSRAGIPIYMSQGKGGGISLLPNFILDKAILTQNEKENILSSLNAINSLAFNKNDTSIQKLSALFGNNNNNDWIEVDFSSWTDNSNEIAIFNVLKTAILKKYIVSFIYSNTKGEISTRLIEPLRLCFKSQAWYLHGYCTKKNDYRLFKLRRMRELTVSITTFSRICDTPIFDYSYKFDEKLINLKLKISKKLSFRVYDEFDDVEELPNGDFIVNMKAPSDDWVLGYIFSFDEHCEILEPENFRKLAIEKLEKMVKNYK